MSLYNRLKLGKLIIDLIVEAINKLCNAFASILTTLGLVYGELMNNQVEVSGVLFLPLKIVLITNVNIGFSNLVKSFMRGVNSDW